jgi:hypothetical protein
MNWFTHFLNQLQPSPQFTLRRTGPSFINSERALKIKVGTARALPVFGDQSFACEVIVHTCLALVS